MSDINKYRKSKKWLLYFGIFLIVIALWGVFWFGLLHLNLFENWAEGGVFGDSFGFISSLFSGLAFAGLIVTILKQQEQLKIQRDDLELQRKELELTREELKGQKEQMELQTNTIKTQQFENMFFQMMRILDETTKSIRFRITEITETGDESEFTHFGKDCFKLLFESYKRSYENVCERDNSGRWEPVFNIAYEEFSLKHHNQIDTWFNHLFTFLEFIDKSEIGDNNKKIYANLVRIQLSHDELLIVFYLCLSEKHLHFKELVTKYSMFVLFKDLALDIEGKEYWGEVLIDEDHMDRRLYGPKAFDRNK